MECPRVGCGVNLGINQQLVPNLHLLCCMMYDVHE